MIWDDTKHIQEPKMGISIPWMMWCSKTVKGMKITIKKERKKRTKNKQIYYSTIGFFKKKKKN